MIYLDNNATTRPAAEARQAALRAMDEAWGNPSSIHAPGRAAAQGVARARAQVAGLAGVAPDRVVFTSGATEANEAVLHHGLRQGAALVTSAAEHPALSGVYRAHAADRLRLVPLDGQGRWRLEALEEALRAGPAMVAVAHASGETGVLQDVSEISSLAAAYGAPLLLDAAQSFGRVAATAFPARAYVTVSAHKLHGPKGVGALILGPEAPERPLVQVGGGQEGGVRGGTENTPGIAGFGAACALRHAHFEAHVAQLRALRDTLEARLSEAVRDIRINGSGAPRVANTSNITFRGVDGMALMARLEDRGLCCSQVSACSAGRPEPSKALLAMGLSSEDAFSSVRFSNALSAIRGFIREACSLIANIVGNSGKGAFYLA
jgi:cysteine desulfurase